MNTYPHRARSPRPSLLMWTLTLGSMILASMTLGAPALLANDAAPFLEKMLAGYDHPFEMTFSLDMNMDQGGLTMSLDGTGTLRWANATHSSLDMTMNMTLPGSDQPMAVAVKTVSDGTSIWSEIDNPFMGTQVTQVALTDVQTTDTGLTGAFGQNPVVQIQTLQSEYDFMVESVADGTATLAGSLRDDATNRLANAGVPADRMMLELNAETGVLQRMTLGAADSAPLMTMTVDEYHVRAQDEMPLDQFQYTPPEGALVMSPPEPGLTP